MDRQGAHDEIERCRMLLDLRRFGEAQDALRSLVAARPHDGEVLALLAEALRGIGEHEESARAARAALALDPASLWPWLLLTDALIALRTRDEAIDAGRSAVALAPDDWRTHYNLARSLRGGRRRQTREALRAAQEAVRLAPSEGDPHVIAGLCLNDLGAPLRARRAFRQALALDPQNTHALGNLAFREAERGRLRSASRLVTSGLAVDAQQQHLHSNLSTVLHKLVLSVAALPLWVLVVFAYLLEEGSSRAVRVLVLLAAFVLGAGWTALVVRSLPRGAPHLVGTALRQLPLVGKVFLAAMAAVLVGVVVAALAPTAQARTVVDLVFGLLVGALLLAVAGVLVLAVSRLLKRE